MEDPEKEFTLEEQLELEKTLDGFLGGFEPLTTSEYIKLISKIDKDDENACDDGKL